MSVDGCRSPVAFFIFNRPSLTRRVLGSIAAVRPKRLLVVADGPRTDHPDDLRLVKETREVIESVDWPCDVLTCYSEVNLGCGARLASGLDWVFDTVREAIILEDDCLPEPSFFRFCDELLERYRNEPQVHHINATNPLFPRRFSNDSYYFSRIHNVWGWATWARAWSHYDFMMTRWPEVRSTPWLEKWLEEEMAAKAVTRIFDEMHGGPKPTWDFQWVFSSWLAGGLAITPAVNLVSNIGFGELGTHERDPGHRMSNRPSSAMHFPLRHPGRIEVVAQADAAVWRSAHPSYYKRAGEVVIGTAIGIPPERVRRFLTSLRAGGYVGDVVLFGDAGTRRALADDPAADGVTWKRARQWLPFKLDMLRRPRRWRWVWRPLAAILWALLRVVSQLPLDKRWRRRLQRPLATVLLTPMDSRFLRYEHYLAANPHSRVLITDVRDVVFQGDPFAALPRHGLAVGIETSAYSIATGPHNAKWVRRVYGPAMLEKIGACRVSCVGVTYGDQASIDAYLEQVNEELLGLSPERAGVGGADTAIHNMLLWTGRLGEVQHMEPLSSPLATLNDIPDERVNVAPEGRLLNDDGSEPVVLHQYDRVQTVHDGVRKWLGE